MYSVPQIYRLYQNLVWKFWEGCLYLELIIYMVSTCSCHIACNANAAAIIYIEDSMYCIGWYMRRNYLNKQHKVVILSALYSAVNTSYSNTWQKLHRNIVFRINIFNNATKTLSPFSKIEKHMKWQLREKSFVCNTA